MYIPFFNVSTTVRATSGLISSSFFLAPFVAFPVFRFFALPSSFSLSYASSSTLRFDAEAFTETFDSALVLTMSVATTSSSALMPFAADFVAWRVDRFRGVGHITLS